jgi:hypothetical protein
MVFTVNGLDAGNWGKVGLTLGGVSCAALLTVMFWPPTSFNARWAVPVVWAVAVAGVASLCFALATLIRVMTLPKANFFGLPIGASVGWGVWLLCVSSAVMLVTASIFGNQLATYLDGIPGPYGQSQAPWTRGWRSAAIITSVLTVISAIAYFGTHWNGDSVDSGSTPTGLPSFPSFPSFSTPSLTWPSFPDLSTSPTTTTTTTTTQRTTTTSTASPADPESASFNRLRDIATDDDSFVTSSLEDHWVAQLSAKRPGLQAEGIIWDNAQILREHLQLRQQYPGARLLWSGSWSNFSAKDFWITVVGIGFSDKSTAQAWCNYHDRDPDHCFAILLRV